MSAPVPSSSRPAWSATDLGTDPHRAADKADRVRQMFTAIARRYDLNNRLHSLWRDQAWRRAAVRLAAPRPTDDVLDVACGTGDLAMAFADAQPASVTGLDFTEAMLDLARVKAMKSATATGIRYMQGDAMNLPFDDARFDIVSIAFGIRNVAEPDVALGEFRRVLRPGGRLVVLEFGRPANPVIRRLNDLYSGRIMPITATLIAGDRSGAYRYLPRSVETFLDRDALSASIRSAGFDQVTARGMTFGICVAYLAGC